MKLALGTVQFGLPYGVANQSGQVTLSTAKTMLELAATNHIDTLDTAIAYGDSESCLGQIGIGNFKIITKLPAVPDNCVDVAGWIFEQVTSSFSRLGVNSAYGLLLHRPEQLLGAQGKAIHTTLQELKNSGKIKKFGISIYAPDELETLMSQYTFDLVQAPFNLVDRRLQTGGWLKRLKEAGVEIHTRSSFLQGLLLMRREDIPAKFKPWDHLWNHWHAWLEQHSTSALQACLSYALSIPEIDRVVVGADNLNQLKEIIEVTNSPLSDDLPDLQSEEENLINPARWSNL